MAIIFIPTAIFLFLFLKLLKLGSAKDVNACQALENNGVVKIFRFQGAQLPASCWYRAVEAAPEARETNILPIFSASSPITYQLAVESTKQNLSELILVDWNRNDDFERWFKSVHHMITDDSDQLERGSS